MKKTPAFLGALSAFFVIGCATDGIRILSYYGDRRSVSGGERAVLHAGIDFDGRMGDSVIAAVGGTVTFVVGGSTPVYGCGRGVILKHAESFYTAYCHLDEISVVMGQRLERGGEVGKVGTTGNSMGVPHVHFEACKQRMCGSGAMALAFDPMPFFVGCFDPTKNQEAHALTYPVRCSKPRARHAPAPLGLALNTCKKHLILCSSATDIMRILPSCDGM